MAAGAGYRRGATVGVKSTQFDIDGKTQTRLYESGRRTAPEFLEAIELASTADAQASVAPSQPKGSRSTVTGR